MDGRNTHRAVRYHDRIGFTGHERELLVARKLLIALWRFLETGVLPDGAVLKEG